MSGPRRRKRLDRGIKVRSDSLYVLSSVREVAYLAAPRALLIAGLLSLPLLLGGVAQYVPGGNDAEDCQRDVEVELPAPGEKADDHCPIERTPDPAESVDGTQHSQGAGSLSLVVGVADRRHADGDEGPASHRGEHPPEEEWAQCVGHRDDDRTR